MSKLKTETIRDTELVRYDSLEVGEIFVYADNAYIRTDNTHWAVRLSTGGFVQFNDEELVSYVKRAELKLTI